MKESNTYYQNAYNPFLKTASITQENNSYTITYGTDAQRKKTVLSLSGEPQQTKIYSGLYEKEISGTTTKELHYIPTPCGTVAVHLKHGSTENTYFLLKDYLGSSLKIVNSEGATQEEHSYDPWGNHRNPANWELSDFTGSYRGYTGHEHLPDFQLINMNVSYKRGQSEIYLNYAERRNFGVANGRMYDPVIGRVLSPDNYVVDATNAQNYNRYSYCLNNPLKYSDPSGQVFVIDDLIIAAMIGAFVNVVVQCWSDNAQTPGQIMGAFGIGAAAGAAGGAVAGSLGGATSLGGAIANGAISGAISGGRVGGFVLGAGNSWMGGSNFAVGIRDGFIGAGWGALSGAVFGGIGGGIRYGRQIISFRKGLDNLNIGEGDAVPATDEFLSKAQKAWYPDAPMDNIRNFSVENIPQHVLDDMNANVAAGATTAYSKGGRYTGESSVYFHPIRAFESANRLFYTMGHEFIHVSQYCYLAGIGTIRNNISFSDLLEYHAYNYECFLGSSNYGGFTANDGLNLSKLFPNYSNNFQWLNFYWTKNVNFIYPF